MAEQEMWASVVQLAFSDATATSTSKTAPATRLERQQARDWLVGNSRDFREVCSLAGVDPDAVREQAQKLQDLGWAVTRAMRAAA